MQIDQLKASNLHISYESIMGYEKFSRFYIFLYVLNSEIVVGIVLKYIFTYYEFCILIILISLFQVSFTASTLIADTCKILEDNTY